MKKGNLHILLKRIITLEKKDKETQKRLEKLEKDNEKLKKWVSRERKKMKPTKWLNDNYVPLLDFDTWMKTINVVERDLQYLFNNGPAEGLFHIIQKQLPLENRRSFPIVVFKTSHISHFFIYKDEKWIKMGPNVLVEFFYKTINPRIFQAQKRWEINHPITLENMDQATETYKRTRKISFNQNALSRIIKSLRKLLGSYLELSVKNIIQYEFIF